MKPNDLVCSRQFREVVIAHYPALGSHRPFARLFAWIAFGSWRCEWTGQLMLPAELLATIEDREHRVEHGNYEAGKFLTRFSEQVAHINLSTWSAIAVVQLGPQNERGV